jgi:hypothetical protein
MVAENQRAEKAIAEHEQAQKEKIGRIPDPIVQPEPIREPELIESPEPARKVLVKGKKSGRK